MYVITCLKAGVMNEVRYVNRGVYPYNTDKLVEACYFESVKEAREYVNFVCQGMLDTGDGWIMVSVDEIVTKHVEYVI